MSIKSYKDNNGSMKSAWKGDKRYGFVSKDRIADSQLPSERYTTRYGAGIDNLPLRGNSYNELNTLLGTLDYGNEGDTAFAGFTPNLERTQAPGIGQDYVRSQLGNALLQAGVYHNDTPTPSYFTGAFLPGDRQYIPDVNTGINTPIGRFGLETNYDSPNTVEASFTPQQYVQALLNALRR